MGLYVRRDSPFYWMLLERPGQKPILESTKVPVAANSKALAKQQQQEAQEIYIARMNDLARATHRLPPKRTISFQEWTTWYDTHILPKHRGAERERIAIDLHLKPHFGHLDLLAITPQAVDEYETARLTAKASANTINREVAVLKAMLKAAVPRYLLASPLAGRKTLRVVTRHARILEADEEDRLLAELSAIDRAFVIVATDTLIRLSNVINLRRDEYKGDHLALRDSKTGPYTVPLSARARKALGTLKGTGEYFFPHRRVAKNPRDWRGAVKLMLQRACKRAGIPYGRAEGGITWHTATRATGATRMLRAGFDPRTVQAVGNWKDARSMQTYLHTNMALMQKAVDSITAELHIIPAKPKPPKTHSKTRKKPG